MAAEGPADNAEGHGFSFGAIVRRSLPITISIPSMLPKPSPPAWGEFSEADQLQKQQGVAQAAQESRIAAQRLHQLVQLPGVTPSSAHCPGPAFSV